jgi:hypothetical protein
VGLLYALHIYEMSEVSETALFENVGGMFFALYAITGTGAADGSQGVHRSLLKDRLDRARIRCEWYDTRMLVKVREWVTTMSKTD